MIDRTISPFIHKDSLMIKSETPMKQVIDLLFKHKISGAPVIDESKAVIGFISEKDCIHKLLQAAYHCDRQVPTVNDVMAKNVIILSPNDRVLDVAEKMVSTAPKLYPVVEHGKCIGIINRSDILKALLISVDNCF